MEMIINPIYPLITKLPIKTMYLLFANDKNYKNQSNIFAT